MILYSETSEKCKCTSSKKQEDHIGAYYKEY